VPRVLVDISRSAATQCSLFGKSHANAPFGIAPMGI
jgi:isopentenyl diphosphate isomerase/L-lactate dehydrogenase-like FMN-dependent dehydrogenase